jgi:chromosomal replication initiation ATPase DnaA
MTPQIIPLGTRKAFDTIKQDTCAEFQVSPADFDGPARHWPLCAARKLAWWRARQRMQVSFARLGEWSGGRDHSTVWSGVRELECRMRGKVFPAHAMKRERALKRSRDKKERSDI